MIQRYDPDVCGEIRKRQQEIAELREEIADQELAIEGYRHAAKFYERHAVTDPVAATLWANHKHTIEVKTRTLARLQSALAELKKGTKEKIMATDYTGYDATRLPLADDLQMMREAEQQRANGALTPVQIVAAQNWLIGRNFTTGCADGLVEKLAALVQYDRPESWNAEQIEAAHVQTHDFIGASVYLDRLFARLTASTPKTAEESVRERVAELICEQRGYHTVTALHRKDAEEIIAALKESEARNLARAAAPATGAEQKAGE